MAGGIPKARHCGSDRQLQPADTLQVEPRLQVSSHGMPMNGAYPSW